MSDGRTTKGWALVNQDGNLEDSDDGASSTSSCDVALDEDVVHFRHTPRRSNSVISNGSPPGIPPGSPPTPTNLMVPSEVSPTPVTPTNASGESTVPANFWAHQTDSDQMASSTQSTDSNASPHPQQLPTNQWPQGARPKTTNLHGSPANYLPGQSLQQSSSSGSTLTEDTKQTGYQSPNDEDDVDTDEEVDKMLAGRISEEKADTSSMSSIEILNMPASDEMSDREEQLDVEEKYPIIQPLMSSSALCVEAGKPPEAQASDHHSSSDTDSDFVRVDQSMVPDTEDNQEEQDGDANMEDNEEHDEGAIASSQYEDDRWNRSRHGGDSNLDNSLYSLGAGRSEVVAPSRVVEVAHPRYHHPILPEEEEEEEEILEEDAAGPSHRFAGEDILGRHYFARRLNRDLSASVSSSASDLSSFSFLGLGRHPGRRSMHRQHSDDMSEISSVFTDGSDDLPANMMVGTTKPGPKQYKHKRAERLNTRLNYLVLLVLASVLALGIGHYVGSYQEKYYKHHVRQGQVKRLRELQDDLITCLDKRTTETDDKKTFSDMVKSLLGDSVKDDSEQVLISDENNIGQDDNDEEDENLDCDSCREGKNRYSEKCNTLCVQGGFWAELDEAISELPLPEESMAEMFTPDFVEDDSEEDVSTAESAEDNTSTLKDIPVENEASEKEGVTKVENLQDTSPKSDDKQGGFWAEIDEAIWDMPLPEESISDFPADEDSDLPYFDIENDFGDEITTTDKPQCDDHLPEELPVEDVEIQTDDVSVEESQQEETTDKQNQEEQMYSYEEAMAIKDKFEKKRNKLEKQDNLEEEEIGYIPEQFIVMPEHGEEEVVTIIVEKKQDKLEEEEDGYIDEKVIILPPIYLKEEDTVSIDEEGDEKVMLSPVTKEEGEEISISIGEEDAEKVIIMTPPVVNKEEEEEITISIDEDDAEIVIPPDITINIDDEDAEKVVLITPTVVKEEDEEITISTDEKIAEKVILITPPVVKEEVEITISIYEDDAEQVTLMTHPVVNEEVIISIEEEEEEDDNWVFIEVEDEDGNLHVDSTPKFEHHHSESRKQNVYVNEEVSQDTVITDEETSDIAEDTPQEDDDGMEPTLPDLDEQDTVISEEITSNIVIDTHEDDMMKARLQELEEQLQVAKTRADMWQKKYVKDHHHRLHPEMIVVNSNEENIETKEELDSFRKVEELQEQLNVANNRADKWQSLHREKLHTSRETTNEDNTKKDSSTSDEPKEKMHKDKCGPLGCFTVFENILKSFLDSAEGQEFLRFANLTQVLNNATFWEEFVSATNITAYTISDTVYQSYLEFQDYVRSAQSSDFVSSFSAVLARAGKSVATAFGAVKNYSTTVGDKAQTAWSNMKNYTSDTIDQHNIHLNNISQLKEKVAAAWDTVRNMSAKVVNNDTKKKFSEVVGQVHENVKEYVGNFHENFKDMRQTMKDSWTSVKDTVGKWHHEKKHGKKHKGKGKHHDKWHKDEDVEQTGGEEDVATESRSRKQTKSEDHGTGNKEGVKHQCKGKKCHEKKHDKKKQFGPEKKQEKKNKHKDHGNEDKQFGPTNKHETKNKHKNHGHEKKKTDSKKHHKQEKSHHHKQQDHQEKNEKKHGKHDHWKKKKHQRMDTKWNENIDNLWDIDWEDILNVFNMNCYGASDCMSHHRSDAAKLYDELTEYKKWLKTQDRKRKLKEVRKFLETLGDFLSEPDLDDEDLENLKEDFEEVLENVGRFVQDQHDRSNENIDDDEIEINSTVILDVDMMNKENKDDDSSHSVPERRKFAGFGYQSSEDDDNWFLRRAKDREEHYQDKWNHPPTEDIGTGGQDVNWYLHWMQGRTDSRTGVTVWDMYRWITDKFENREDMRQYDEINWFLKRP
ncbi:LOW QUALITY PROTEIN: uncharacterized protein [Amphiura filiformis]|uniref:LOW QUALITY PROTEIN: uncharacterized protein n=1 Tax=Amphiura filiformis TaxID=82378 RepID=UPI003B223DB3